MSFGNPRTIAAVALSLSIAIAVLDRGGVDTVTQAAVLAASALALLAASFVSAAAFRAPLLLLGLAVALLGTIIQLVPLPPAIFAWLSPGTRDVFEVALGPLGLYPAARPATLDVPSTAREVAKAGALLCAGAAAVLLGGRARSRDTMLAVICGTGVASVAFVIGGALLGRARLLGSGGPFVNPNHLAAFLSLAALPALGRGLRERGLVRAAWVLAFVVAGTGVFMSLSRGGIAAFFVGAAVFALLYVRRNEAARAAGPPRARRWLRHAVPPAATALVLAVAVYVAFEPLLEEVRSVARVSRDPRTEIWPEALAVLARHPVLGIGRGAFSVAFPGYHRGDTLPFTYTHVENEWLQLPIDLGVPVGLVVVASVAWAWLGAARRSDLSRADIGALSGTAAVAAHSVFDFGLELPGVAVPFVVLLGLLGANARGLSLGSTWFRAAAVGAAVAGAAGLRLSAAHPPTEVDSLSSLPAGEVAESARMLVRWRPADYLPHAVAGARLAGDGRCREGMEWLTRAMWLAPSVPDPHRYAARCLAESGQDALARREYRLAWMLGDTSVLEEAVSRWIGGAALADLVPETPEALEKLASLLDRERRRAEAAEVLEQGARDLSDPGLLFRLGQLRVAMGEHARALELARELRDREPGQPRAYVLASFALRGMGDAEGALRELEAGLERLPRSPAIVLALGSELSHQKRFAQATRVLASGAWRTAAEAAQARQLRIGALRAQGRLAEAVAEARVARELDPRNLGTNVLLAEVLAEAGLVEEAVGVLADAASLPGADRAGIAARLEELRAAVRGTAPVRPDDLP